MFFRALFLGSRAERLAARYLRRKHGYRILARNVRAGPGEIDLLAQDGETLVVVEVRRRGTITDAVLSVGRDKERTLLATLRAVSRKFRLPPSLKARGDLVLIDGEDRIVLLRGALWRASSFGA